MSPELRAVRRLVGSWFVAVLAGPLDAQSSLGDAERWFWGSDAVSSLLDDCAVRRAQPILTGLALRPNLLSMLPYALDPFPPAYRRDTLRSDSATSARVHKKTHGAFFTPSDVANHVVRLALAQIDPTVPRFALMDPAVGTGVFLRAALLQLVASGLPPPAAAAVLHGVDLDECSVDMCAFVLLVDTLTLMAEPIRESPAEFWWRTRNQLLAADALRTFGGLTHGEAGEGNLPFDDVPLAPPYNVLVGNPPYSPLGDRDDFEFLRSQYQTLKNAGRSTSAYLPFVELLGRQLVQGGAGSMVVPLSIAYGTAAPQRQLRASATSAGGTWQFEFFDRTPDALFGDDVKQRTAIVTRATGGPFRVFTSPVVRWTSRNRESLFEHVPRVDLPNASILNGIPKVGTPAEARAITTLRSRDCLLGADLVSMRSVAPNDANNTCDLIYVGNTAYNWLNIYRAGSALLPDDISSPTNTVYGLQCRSAEQADALYAILASRAVYWLWRVEGDAFHVTAGWILRIPFGLSGLGPDATKGLGALGRALWQATSQHPVKSSNKGRTTVSYCPYGSPQILSLIDAQLVNEWQLGPTMIGHLERFVRDLAVVGRTSPADVGLKRALAAWGPS